MKKILYTLPILGLNLFNYSSADYYDPVVDRIDSIWSTIVNIVLWVVSAVKFIVRTMITLFTYLGRAFSDIFDVDFFGYIKLMFQYLNGYFGSFYGSIFLSLFVLAFLIILYGFVMRLIKGQTNYNTALKKLKKSEKSSK